ncbi:ParB-like protein [Paraburkholderia mimosarum]|uniref:ParB-like protein n=1 Tax=Paraburkholderia mimosarum TaxID=312026 RepID=UPI0039C15DFB
METVHIEALRPTQATHGEREVNEKTRTYRSLDGPALQKAIAEKPVPIVLGPEGAAFLIDHHHVASALWRADVHRVPIVLVRDLSALSLHVFWLTLENQRWTWPYDASGARISFLDMPVHVWEASDDEFRSVAAAVRGAGGYSKSSEPLQEFLWADFFRRSFTAPRTDDAYREVVEAATKLARTRAALGLPGFLGATGEPRS